MRRPSVLGRGLSFWQDWGNIYGPVMTVVLNGSDPTIFLTNGTRIVLGLEGESTRTQSVVQAAQDAYFAEHGVWPYVEGMPNKGGSTPPKTTIGTVSVSGAGLTGTNLALTTGTTSDITAAFSGDASDVSFKWTIRSWHCSVDRW